MQIAGRRLLDVTGTGVGAGVVRVALSVPVTTPLTSRRAVDLCRVGSCLCRLD